MAIDKDTWLKAQALFEIGKSLSDISESTGIDRSSISKRAKKECWDKSKNQQLVEENIKAIQKVENLKDKIQQKFQHPIQQEVIQQEINDQLQIMKNITNLHKGALNLHNVIIKKTYQQTQTGEITPREASQILANTGMKVDQIHRAYNPEQPTTAIQINNENKTEEKVIINIEGI